MSTFSENANRTASESTHRDSGLSQDQSGAPRTIDINAANSIMAAHVGSQSTVPEKRDAAVKQLAVFSEIFSLSLPELRAQAESTLGIPAPTEKPLPISLETAEAVQEAQLGVLHYNPDVRERAVAEMMRLSEITGMKIKDLIKTSSQMLIKEASETSNLEVPDHFSDASSDHEPTVSEELKNLAEASPDISEDPVPKGFIASGMDRLRGVGANIKEALTPKVVHTVDSPTRLLLEDALQAVKDAPKRVQTALVETFTSFYDSIKKGELPISLKSFVKYVLDAIALAMTSDPIVIGVIAARMAMDYGLVVTGLINAFSLLVRQFTKRVELAVDHGDNDMALPTPASAEKETILDSIKAFYTMAYHYVMGVMPPSLPMQLIKQLVAYNTIFVFGRNIQPIGAWIVGMLKQVVDYLWVKVMGVPFFDDTAKRAADELSTFTVQVLTQIRAKNDSNTAGSLRGLVESYPTIMANAVASKLPKEVLDMAKTTFNLANQRLSDVSTGSTPLGNTCPSVITLFYGGAGSGKTVLNEFLCRAISKSMGYTTGFDESVYMFQADLGFQKKPPAVCDHWISDDALLLEDPDAAGRFYNNVLKFGAGHPIIVEMSTAENRFHQLLPKFCHILENRKPEPPVATPDAFSRRINGGSWEVTVKPEFKAGKYLDFPALIRMVNTHGPSVLNNVFSFQNGTNIYNFTELVSALCNLRRSIDSGAARAALSSAIISAQFEQDTNVVLPEDVLANNKFDAPNPRQIKVSGTVGTYLAKDHAAGMPHQQFVEFCRASGVPNDKIPRMWNFIRASPKTFTISNGLLLANGSGVTLSSLVAKFIDVDPPLEIDVAVSLEKITARTFAAMRTRTFTIKGTCCRTGDWCYKHGRDMCASYDDNALETNFTGFCWWLTAHRTPDLLISQAAAIHAATHSPVEEDPAYTALRFIGYALLGSGVGVLVAVAVNAAFSYLRPQPATPADHAEYSPKVHTTGARKGRSFPPLGLAPADHAGNPLVPAPLPEISNSWVLDYLTRCSIPISVHGAEDVSNSHMLGLVGNLAVANRHPFLRKRDKIAFAAPINAVLPYKICTTSELLPGTTYVQIVTVPARDIVFLILPKAAANFRDTTKHWVNEDTDLSKLVKCCLAMRRNTPIDIHDGRVLPRELPPLSTFPLGDVNAVRSYTSSAEYTGLYIRTAVGTVEGNCGLACYSTSTHINRGSACLMGIVAAFSEATGEQIIAPLSRENILEFISLVPAGVLHTIKDHSESLALDPPTAPHLPNVVWSGSIPGRKPFMNTKNDVFKLPPPIFHALDGMQVDFMGKKQVIQPIHVRPANLRDIDAATAKYQQSTFVPAEPDFQHWIKCVEATKDDILNKCNPRLVEPQTELWSLDAVLNGVPEFGIPGIDPRKSPGFDPAGQPANGRYKYLVVGADGRLDLNKEYKTKYYEALHSRLNGELPQNFVLINPKPELRPFATPAPVVDIEDLPARLNPDGQFPDHHGPAKRPRLTGTMEFINLLVDRTFALHLPAMLISGQLMNGMSFGADLNGIAGQEYGLASKDRPFVNASDASNYDASKGVFYSYCNETVCSALIRARFPFVSDSAACTVPRSARVGRYIIGGNVADFNTGFISGHFLTTVSNCADMATQGRYTFTKYGGMSQEAYSKQVFASSYGDDYRSANRKSVVVSADFVRAGKELGITLTPTSKTDGTPTDHVDPALDTHLKRYSVEVDGGRFMAPLELTTLNHIHAFARGPVHPSQAAPVNARAALREWFYYGRTAFEEAKSRLDSALTACGYERTGLDYLDLYNAWENRFHANNSFRLFGRSVEEDPNPIFDHAQEMPRNSTAPDLDTRNVSKVNPDSVSKTDATGGVVSQSQLSKFRDGSALLINEPTPAALASAKTELNPYGLVGVEEPLTRVYEITDGNWATADTPGHTIYACNFPERMFGIQGLSDRLARIKYLRCGVKVTVRVNGNQFVGGSALANMLPCHVTGGADAWREDLPILRNSNPAFVSASTSAAVSLEQAWQCPATWYDLTTLSPVAAIGRFILTVNTKLEWMSDTPPTGVNYKVFAQFTDVQVAGYSLNPGPALMLRKPTSTLKTATRNPRKGGNAKDHSSEAKAKSSMGITEGVQSATDGIQSVVGAVTSLMPLLALLDKPPSIQASQPTFNAIARDMTHVDGMSQVPTIAAHQTSLIATSNKVMGEVSPQPSWEMISSLPGVARTLTISPADTVGTVIADMSINPNLMVSADLLEPPVNFVLTPAAYVGTYHRYWHGGFKFCVYFWGPSTQKASIRITYNPEPGVAVAVSPDDTGDVASGVYDVVGDTEIAFEIPYLSPYAQLPMANPTAVGTAENSIGSLTIQIVSPIAAQSTASRAPIHGLVYIATAKGFVWDSPALESVGYLMVTERPAAPVNRKLFGAEVKNGGKASDHASVRARFGANFPGLVPFTPKSHSGLVDPDKTHGIVEYLKRSISYGPETIEVAPGASDIVQNGGVTEILIHPYKFWSGSSVRKYVLSEPLLPTTPGLVRLGGNSRIDGTSGVAFFDLSKDPSFGLNMPFSSAVPAREVYVTHPEFLLGELTYYWATVGTALPNPTQFQVYRSAGDDFSLYCFIAPAYYLPE